jgi:hypothetical protein
MCLCFCSFIQNVTVEVPVPFSVHPFWHTAFCHQFYDNCAQFVVVITVIVTPAAASPLAHDAFVCMRCLVS